MGLLAAWLRLFGNILGAERVSVGSRSRQSQGNRLGRAELGATCTPNVLVLYVSALFALPQCYCSGVEAPKLLKESTMAYVIAEPCIGTKDTACVDVCPVDCIHPRKDEPTYESETQLYINPVECIDCGACVPVCPVTAIFALDDLPEKWQNFTPINADWYTKKA
jgi:ferredoxin